MFPSGFIFASGDVCQFPEIKEYYNNFFYSWDTNVDGGHFSLNQYSILYYFPFYIANRLGFSDSMSSFLFYFIFLLGSFLSFYFALNLFSQKTNENKLLWIILSMLYTINPYTLYVFTYIWGYSPFLILYIFIPLIFASTIKYFLSDTIFNINLAYIGIIFVFSSVSFGNYSFVVSLWLFLIILIILINYLSSKFIYLVKKSIIFVLVFVLSTFYITIPQIPELFNMYSGIVSSNAIFNLSNWILSFRLSILSQFFWVPNASVYISIYSVIFFCALFVFLILFAITWRNSSEFTLTFIILALLSIFITAKGKGIISDPLCLNIFGQPLINSLRSPDKTFIYLPFFFLISIFFGLKNISTQRAKYILFFGFIFVTISCFPFFLGGFQTQYGQYLDPHENYLNSKTSGIVKIPEPYYNAANIINSDFSINKILHLPYSVINSVGWVNYPKWKLIGVDPTVLLFHKPFIQPNSYSTFNYNYGNEWNLGNILQNDSILKFMSIINAKYIIYHKDVDNKFILTTRDKIKYLEKINGVKLIQSNEFFDLYMLSNELVLPHIYSTHNFVFTKNMESTFEYIGSNNFSPNETVIFTAERLNEDHIKELNNISALRINSPLKNESLKIDLNFFWANTKEKAENTNIVDYYAELSSNNFIKCYNLNSSEGQQNIMGFNLNKSPVIKFQKINPTKYEVNIKTDQPLFLVFSETYHPQWKAYIEKNFSPMNEIITNYTQVNVQETQPETQFTPCDIFYLFSQSLPDNDHFLVNGYANAWYINPTQLPKDSGGNINITLYFLPQSLFYLGLIISGTTLLISIGYLAYNWRKRKNKIKLQKNEN